MISVEANVGAGKSTFLKIFGERWPEKFNVIYEPLDEWQTKYSDVNNNILGMFYEDIPRWGYTFQSNAFITRIQKFDKERVPGKINLTERSIFSDRNIFAQMLYDDGKMNTIEWKLYQNWFTWLSDKFNAKPEAIIYLQCDPQIAYERVKKRARTEEEAISLEYLTRLHDYHEKWLNGAERENIPVKILNVDEAFVGNESKIQTMYQQILA